MDDQPRPPAIQPDLSHALTIVARPRTIEVLPVTEGELRQIAAASNTFALHLAFTGIGTGGAVAFLIAVLTATLSDRLFALFWALFGVAALAAVYSGIQAISSHNNVQKAISTITTRPRHV